MGSGRTRAAFVTYETPLCPCGGISAVMDFLPGHLDCRTGSKAVVISPAHFYAERLTRAAFSGELETAARFTLELPLLQNKKAPMLLLKWLGGKTADYYFITPEGGDPFDPPLFAGSPHPYRLDDDPGTNAEFLLRDSLVFGLSTVRALAALDREADWRLLLQDWEAATTVLALAGAWPDPPIKAKAWLTLHNAYDIPLEDPTLLKVGIDPKSVPDMAARLDPQAPRINTVLRRALPHLDRTVFTVSRQYAIELCSDIYQSDVMTPHLKKYICLDDDPERFTLKGVDNGCFQKLAVPQEILTDLEHQGPGPLYAWKTENRQKFLTALLGHKSTKYKPLWGDARVFGQNSAGLTWFAMGGRDDPRQKGYDVMVSAVEKFLARDGGGHRAGFLFFPIPGDEGLEGLKFMQDLARKRPDAVIALPFRFAAGYMAAMHGASYYTMPSLYEPFGGINEAYLWGSVGLGRATGGLMEQVKPLATGDNQLAQTMAAKYHGVQAPATGLLYRERVADSDYSDWQTINRAAYAPGDRLKDRAGLPLFEAMSDELCRTMLDADRIYQQQRKVYCDMFRAGLKLVTGGFTWDRAVSEYDQTIKVCDR